MQRTPREWLLEYMRAGLDCVAVTDHNTGMWVDQLKKALSELDHEKPEGYRPLVLFPGVELSIGRVHALVLLDPDKESSDVSAIIGAARFRGTPGQSNDACAEDVTTIAEEVHKQGGLFIPAHSDRPGGFLTELSGNDLRPWLNIQSIVGAEFNAVSPTFTPIDGIATLPWTPILGSDSHHPVGQGNSATHYPGSHWSWIKMEKPGIEGLRLALIDGAMSVRRSVDEGGASSPNTLPERMITSLKVNGTYVMGNGKPVHIGFSSWLNAFIGDRGTGKSSVVHFLRQALARNKEEDFGITDAKIDGRAWRTFKNFMSYRKGSDIGALREGSTRIELQYLLNGALFKVISEGATNDHKVQAYSADGNWIPARSQEVRDRFRATMISQGQLTDLIDNDREGLLRLVDDAVDKAGWNARWAEQLSRFYALSARVRELSVQLAQAERLKAQQDDINRKLVQFETSNHAKVLRDFQRQSRQSREVKAVFDRIEEIDDELSTLHQDGFVLGDIASEVFDTTDAAEQEVIGVMADLENAVTKAKNKLDEARSLLRLAKETARKQLIISAWAQQTESAKKVHADLVERLRSEGVSDPTQFSALVQQRQLVEQQMKRLLELSEELKQVLLDRLFAQEDLKKLRKDLIALRCDFLWDVLENNDYVQMQLIPFGSDEKRQNEQIRNWLDLGEDGFPGDVDVIRSALYHDLSTDIDTRRDTFLNRLHNLKIEFLQIISGAEVARFSKHLRNRLQRNDKPEYKDRIESWYPEDGITLKVNGREQGMPEWRDVETVSAGQRSAALLAFLLSYGDEPIILDQPEDDLDNKVVFELVVRGIRENKKKRQIIVITHDANIVVNGDAEAVHIMKYATGQCWLERTASLQNDDLRLRICNILEGGREAFQKRYHRLLETKR